MYSVESRFLTAALRFSNLPNTVILLPPPGPGLPPISRSLRVFEPIFLYLGGSKKSTAVYNGILTIFLMRSLAGSDTESQYGEGNE